MTWKSKATGRRRSADRRGAARDRLLDIGLPGLDGYEVARRVRERPEGKGIRLYAMTGYGQEEDRNAPSHRDSTRTS
jgi:CheY-like chemotaxis protein